MKKKLAIITGCDSGIGFGLCKLMALNGFSVAASYLEHDPFPSKKNIFSCKMDIRKEKEIDNFTVFVKEYCNNGYSLDCLINNAGVALGGPIENLPMKIFRENFEVNFFGLVSLTKKLIPLLIQSSGRILIIGSMAGRIALPFLSPYVSTKFALEGFSDSLRRELLPFGIKTVLIEPGGIATPIWNKSKKQDKSFVDKKYEKSLNIFIEKFIESGNSGMDVEKAAKHILKIINKKNPKGRYIVAENRFTTFLPLLIPRRILDKLFLKNFKMDYGNIE